MEHLNNCEAPECTALQLQIDYFIGHHCHTYSGDLLDADR